MNGLNTKACLETNKLLVGVDCVSAWAHRDNSSPARATAVVGRSQAPLFPLEIADCVEKGLGVLATRAFLPGCVIASAPLIDCTCVPVAKYRSAFCMHCRSLVGPEAQAAGAELRAGQLFFCSANCRRQSHLLVERCGALVEFLHGFRSAETSCGNYPGYRDSLVFVALVLYRDDQWKCQCGVGADVEDHGAELGALLALETHSSADAGAGADPAGSGAESELRFYVQFLCDNMARLAPRVPCTPALVLALLRVVRLNAQVLTYNFLPRPVALADGSGSSATLQVLTVLPVFARINHSCSPNAAVVLVPPAGHLAAAGGHSVMLKALRALVPGDEVLCSYLEAPALCLPPSDRRPLLQEAFRFSCRCERCCDEESVPSVPVDPAVSFAALDDRAYERLLERCLGANDMTEYYSYRLRQCAHHLARHRARDGNPGSGGCDSGRSYGDGRSHATPGAASASASVARAVATDPTVLHLHAEVLEEVAALFMNNRLGNRLAEQETDPGRAHTSTAPASTSAPAPPLPLPYVVYELASYYLAFLLSPQSLTTAVAPAGGGTGAFYLSSRHHSVRALATNKVALLLRLAVLLSCFADMAGCALSPLFNGAGAPLAETLRVVVLHTLRFVRACAAQAGSGQAPDLSSADLQFILTRGLLLVSKCGDLLDVYNSRGHCGGGDGCEAGCSGRRSGEAVSSSVHAQQLEKCKLYFEAQLRRFAPGEAPDDTGKWARRTDRS